MINRRRFLLSSIAASLGISLPFHVRSSSGPEFPARSAVPVIISTWVHGIEANRAAAESLASGGSVLDAVEAGVRVSEADPEVRSVGYGGYPDASGEVTLDACIMDPSGNAGSVACLREIKHPVSVARRVMENTPHVMLVGRGAQEFAIREGFVKENLLTGKARKYWEKNKDPYRLDTGDAGHDTIGMLAMDASGNIAGACTTSGLAMKLPGRVGDSPIIGAGLYIDKDAGGAAATGHGELVMKTLGSFLVVELMRNGLSPEDACREALGRIRKKFTLLPGQQVGYVALGKYGQAAACSLIEGFEYALFRNGENLLLKSPHLS